MSERNPRVSSAATSNSSQRYVAREGHMEKQGYFNRGWKRRFFVLRNQTLSYYGDAGEAKPKSVVPLAGSSVVAGLQSDSRAYTFGLKVGLALGGRTYALACASKDDRDVRLSWLLQVARQLSFHSTSYSHHHYQIFLMRRHG